MCFYKPLRNVRGRRNSRTTSKNCISCSATPPLSKISFHSANHYGSVKTSFLFICHCIDPGPFTSTLVNVWPKNRIQIGSLVATWPTSTDDWAQRVQRVKSTKSKEHFSKDVFNDARQS